MARLSEMVLLVKSIFGGGRFRKDTVAVADVLAMAFMFIVLVLAAVSMHAYSSRQLRAAADRQLELKSEHLYQTLELAWVEPYNKSFLDAAAENLILEQPLVPGLYLRSAMENVLEHLRPPDYAVVVILTHDNASWTLSCPDGAGLGSIADKQFVRQGKVRITMAGRENVAVAVAGRLFKLG